MPSLRKKTPLAKPFVISVAHLATVMLAPGCMVNPPGIVEGGGSCPATLPATGGDCFGSLDCDYGFDSCGIPQTATCVGGVWQVSGPVACNPPPPDPQCPVDIPAVGAACNWMWQAGFGCTYTIDIGCGMQTISTMCNPTTVTVEYTAPTCGQCATLTTEATCSTDSACRWLTPGCGMAPLSMAGCFAVANCTSDMDCTTAGNTCQEISYNPCYNKACDACGATANVCLPPIAP